MAKFIPVVVLFLVLSITPVLAKPDNPNANKPQESQVCDPGGEWKNHGQYVSCVAHTHPGGAAVSAAAQSDVGKKNNEESEASPTPVASPTPLISPSPEVTPSPDVTPTPEASATPDVSPSPEPQGDQTAILQSVIDKLNEIIGLLNNLL